MGKSQVCTMFNARNGGLTTTSRLLFLTISACFFAAACSKELSELAILDQQLRNGELHVSTFQEPPFDFEDETQLDDDKWSGYNIEMMDFFLKKGINIKGYKLSSSSGGGGDGESSNLVAFAKEEKAKEKE